MLTGCTPPEDTGWPASTGTPPAVMRRTEIWLLPGVHRQQVPAVRGGLDRALGSQAGAQARAARRERGPRKRGDRAVACRANPSMVLAVAVLPSM